MEFKAESLNIIGNKHIINKLFEHEIASCKQAKTYYDILCCFFEYLYFYSPQYAFQILDNLSRKNPQIAQHIQTIYNYMKVIDKESLLLGIIYQDEVYLHAIKSIADEFLKKSSVDTYNKEFRFEKHIKLIMFLSVTIEVLCIDGKKTGSIFASLKKIGYGVISILFLSLENSLYMLLPNVLSNDLLPKIRNSINNSGNSPKVMFHCGHSIVLQPSYPSEFRDSGRYSCKICNDNLYTMDIGLAKKNHWRNPEKTICGKCYSKNHQFLCIDCEWPLCRGCLVNKGNQCICGLCKFMNTRQKFIKDDVAVRFLNMRRKSLQSQVSNNDLVNSYQCYKSNPAMETLRLEANKEPHPLNSNPLSKNNFAHMNPPAQNVDQYPNFIQNREANQLARPETSNDSCKKCKDRRVCVCCNGLFDKLEIKNINGHTVCSKCYESQRFKCPGCNSQNFCNAILCQNCRIISLDSKPVNMVKYFDTKKYIVIEKKCKKCQTDNLKLDFYCDYCKKTPDDSLLRKPQEEISSEKNQCYFSNCQNLEITACSACRKTTAKFCESHMQYHIQEHKFWNERKNAPILSESKHNILCQYCKQDQIQLKSILCQNCNIVSANNKLFYLKTDYDILYPHYQNYDYRQKQCLNCKKYPIEIKNYCDDCIPLLKAKNPENIPSTEGNFPQFTSQDCKCSISDCKVIKCSKCSICKFAFCLLHMQTHEKEYHKTADIPEILTAPSSKIEPLGDFIKITRKNVIHSYKETIKQIQSYSSEMLKLLDEIENADNLLKSCIGKDNYSETAYKNHLKYLEIPELEVNNCESKAVTERNTAVFLKDIKAMRKKFNKENSILMHFREESSKIKNASDSIMPTDNEGGPQKDHVESPNS